MENAKRIVELNKEYIKYNQAIVKLLHDSLNEGEYFVFKKNKDNSYGLIVSDERESLLNESYETQTNKILKCLNEVLNTKINYSEFSFIGKSDTMSI